MEAVNQNNFADIAQRLHEYRAYKESVNREPVHQVRRPQPQQPQQIVEYEGVVPTDAYQRGQTSNDPIQEQIDRFLQRPIIINNISTEFEKFTTLTTDLRDVRLDFTDNALFGYHGISLDRYTDEEIVTLGRAVIPMISSGFSKKGAAAIFVLAYHLKAPGLDYDGDYVFQDAEVLSSAADKFYHDYPDKIMSIQGHTEVITGLGSPEKEAAVYAYVAASMLRLFTKSPANYVKAWNHILEGFSKFYGDHIEIRLPIPNELAIKGLADWFTLDPRAKVALYRLLYVSNNKDMSFLGLRRFLFDIHLSNTGMHIVSMLAQLCKIMNCSPGLVLTIIHTRETDKQVQCLVKLLEVLVDTGDHHARRMWRYGRIFDETFMADLQTRACPKLVYVMAAALKLEAPKTNQNIFNIAQLADVSEENQRKCMGAAQQLLRAIKMYQSKDKERSIFDILH